MDRDGYDKHRRSGIGDRRAYQRHRDNRWDASQHAARNILQKRDPAGAHINTEDVAGNKADDSENVGNEKAVFRLDPSDFCDNSSFIVFCNEFIRGFLADQPAEPVRDTQRHSDADGIHNQRKPLGFEKHPSGDHEQI